MNRLSWPVGLLGLVLAAGLSACSADPKECGAGREGATELVSDYLGAVSESADKQAVCPFVEDQNVDAAVKLARRLAPRVEKAGGASKVELAEDPSKRMGSSRAVVATADGRTVFTFILVERDKRFFLLPEANA